MIELSWSLILIWSVLTQAGTPPPEPDCLLSAELSRLEKETKLDSRIKIYDGASARCLRSVTGFIQRQELGAIPAHLNSWRGLLERSLKDIEASPGRKDKSKALKQHEIHLRKAISDVQQLRLKAGVEQFDEFEGWLTRAEQIRKRLVEILFPR